MKKTNPDSPFLLDATTLPQLYREAARSFGTSPALGRRNPDGSFTTTSYEELFQLGLNLATALIEEGVRPRDHIGILSDNRLEWMIADYGILIAGAADIPRGTDITLDEMEYILTHGDVLLCFVEDRSVLERLHKIRGRLPGMLRIIMMDPEDSGEGADGTLYDLMEEGARLRRGGDQRAEQRINLVKPEHLFTIIYTSGTTGVPKGVQLTHANMISQVRNIPWPIYREDRKLSILPIWHSYERVCEMMAISRGTCTYYTSIRTIAADLETVKPTIMASAPRVWESLFQKIQKKVADLPPLRRNLFKIAYFCSRQVQGSWFFLSGQAIDLNGRYPVYSALLGFGHACRATIFYLPYKLLDPLALKKIRNQLGGHFRGTISGGGALPPFVDEFFNYIGIPVLEGYGMTETSPVTALRTNQKRVLGTVGPAIPETEFQILEMETGALLYPNPEKPGSGRGLRGILHVRGPQVMSGYYKQPDETNRVLQKGWMNTGDIAMITFNDCLKILGRAKETIVLLSGENVEPAPIEARIIESPMISQCMVLGNDQKYLSALLVPNADYFEKPLPELATDPDLKKQLIQEVRRQVNKSDRFKSFEHVHGVHVLGKPFEVGEELTATFKLRRHIVESLYEQEIAGLYR